MSEVTNVANKVSSMGHPQDGVIAKALDGVTGDLFSRGTPDVMSAPAAAVGTGYELRTLEHLRHVWALEPTQKNLETLERGLRRRQRALGLGKDAFAEWQQALRS